MLTSFVAPVTIDCFLVSNLLFTPSWSLTWWRDGLQSLESLLGIVVVLCGSGIFLTRLNKNGLIKSLKETNEGWEQTARQKNAKIEDLESRVKKLEQDIEMVKQEEDTLRKLNMHYQVQIMSLEEENERLRNLVQMFKSGLRLSSEDDKYEKNN